MTEVEPAQATADRLTAVFETIHRERMEGLPILNTRLGVAVVGAQVWEGDWLGVLVTPWAMNLLALPADTAALGKPGSKRSHSFPSGTYEFIAGDPADIGSHEACSLFSPMHEFADQAAAVATAQEVLKALMTPDPGSAPAPEQPPDRPLARPLTRRGLFRALSGHQPDPEPGSQSGASG